MGVGRPTFVIVPGRGDSGPDHWQSLFAAGRENVARVRQKNWDRPTRRAWVSGLDETVKAVEGRIILVAHSLGVLTVVHWAAWVRSQERVAGALLVAPPDMDGGVSGLPPRWLLRLLGWAPSPMMALPFRALVVSSANDPMCASATARRLAKAWGADFHDLGLAGHINVEAGYGHWKGLDALLAKFEN